MLNSIGLFIGLGILGLILVVLAVVGLIVFLKIRKAKHKKEQFDEESIGVELL